MQLDKIRNFCIIAHIDHGKSTLADRFLEITGTVPPRAMKAQLLDQLDIERERGITVKLTPVRMEWQGYELNLIDTPGHVDFTYEVSRSLAAVEGAILVVDATQGIQAQTLANVSLARAQGLTIIPVINKIDLPNADIKTVVVDLVKLLNVEPDFILQVSAKDGTGVPAILAQVIKSVPPPGGRLDQPLRALIFDSVFDTYRGVVAFIRVVDGRVAAGDKICFTGTKAQTTVLEAGVFKPQLVAGSGLQAGEIGYLVTGLKDVSQSRVGDTVTALGAAVAPLPGYRQLPAMVFAGIFTESGDQFPLLRDALGKLKLNDAALTYEPEQSPALGHGFRCGFLGLLHLDIVRERLDREYGLKIIITVPSVAYQVYTRRSSEPLTIRSPLHLPDPSLIERIEEPLMTLRVVTPAEFIGAVMSATQDRRGEFQHLDYLDPGRAVITFSIPLASILVDYYDTLKSISSGYASLNYEFTGYRPTDAVKLDILVADQPVEALSTIVYRDTSYQTARRIVTALKDVLPRQMFEVKIQAAIGGKVIAAERLPAMRKDVTAKLYGGDVTRKRKLLAKQKKGKRRMKNVGQVSIPQAAYLAILKR